MVVRTNYGPLVLFSTYMLRVSVCTLDACIWSPLHCLLLVLNSVEFFLFSAIRDITIYKDHFEKVNKYKLTYVSSNSLLVCIQYFSVHLIHNFKLFLLVHRKITKIKFHFFSIKPVCLFFQKIRPVKCGAFGYARSIILCSAPDACDRAPTTPLVAKSALSLPDLNRKCCPRKPLMCEESINMGKPLVRKHSFSSTSLWANIACPPFFFHLDSYQTASKVIKNIKKSAICFVIYHAKEQVEQRLEEQTLDIYSLWQGSVLKTYK